MIAIQYVDTITLGAVIISILLGIAGLLVFGYGARWKAALEVAEATIQTLEEGRAAYMKRSERLQDELQQHLLRLGECKAQLAEALARPSQETVVELLEKMDAHATDRTVKAVEAVQQAMAAHERHAQERFDKATERQQERHELQMAVMVELAHGLKKQNGQLSEGEENR